MILYGATREKSELRKVMFLSGRQVDAMMSDFRDKKEEGFSNSNTRIIVDQDINCRVVLEHLSGKGFINFNNIHIR